jgi:RNA polymerase sigma factor (sigma-70 family)
MTEPSPQQALESLFKDQYGKMYTLAFRMTGSRENAEDALQDAFLNAFTALAGFRGESALSTWVYRIVFNASQKLSGEARKLPVTLAAEARGITEDEVFAHVAGFGTAEDEALINRTRESCVQVFINCMPKKLRAVYTLRGILHFSVKDTAEILDISEAAVKVDFHRARSVAEDHFNGRCSLVKPGAKCDCRAFAQYLIETKRTNVLLNVAAIHRREAAAKTKFLLEMKQILGVDELYDCDFDAGDFEAFKTRVKALRSTRSLSLLDS